MTPRSARCWLLLAVALATQAPPARAGWQPGGVPVCLHPSDQQQPHITGDGGGGAYVMWRDSRDRPVTDADLYLQHVTASGDLAPGWPVTGLPLCTAPGPQFRSPRCLVADGEGGVLATWWDRRSGNQDDIYVQRIGPNGSPAPGWPVDGVRVTNLPLSEQNPVVESDGAGGAFAAWVEGRNGNADIYAMHLLADGIRAPGWPENGLAVSTGPLSEGNPVFLVDGTGGVIVAWVYGTASGTEVRALRLTAAGEVAPGWVAGGKVVCSAPGGRGNLHIVSDGTGGGVLAWDDYRTAPPGTTPDNLMFYADIYAQRFTSTGEISSGWPADGLALCTQPNIQWDVDLAGDGAGGGLVAWVDYRAYDPNYSDVFAVRVLGNGTLAPGWTAQGTRASTAEGFQLTTKVVADGLGGMYLLIKDFAAEGYKLSAQHLTVTGQLAPGWPSAGIRVVEGAGQQDDQQAMSDGMGGAIVTWTGGPSGPNVDIFAQRIGVDGPTPVLVSLVSAEAEAGLVRLTWYAGDGLSLAADVERRIETGDWEQLASITADGSGTLRYEDRTVVPDTRYAYRLTYRDGAETAHTAEVWVTVPSLRFALRGLTPNPSAGDPVVSFSLASDAPASIELFDLHGRLVLSHEAGAPGPGAHSVRLEGRGRLPAGVYTVRLRQGMSLATARAVIVR